MALHYTTWASLAALSVYFWMALQVAKARVTYHVKAPSSDGPDDFLRIMRVQINTTEQMIIFLPALWMCAIWLGDQWAGLGGAAWVLGRIIYALGYYRAANKRDLGFVITISASIALMVGTVVGMVR